MKPSFNDKGLLPVIVQDSRSHQVLMLGYMNEEALAKTNETGLATFFSRSKQRLWTKGESSGNFLYVKDLFFDCDKDTILLKADPSGPVCHNGTWTCFAEETGKGYLYQLQDTIARRIGSNTADSYTSRLFAQGINKMAQKLGEEAVELVIEAKDDNMDLFKNEAADLLYHLLVLLKAKNTSLEEIELVLKARSR